MPEPAHLAITHDNDEEPRRWSSPQPYSVIDQVIKTDLQVRSLECVPLLWNYRKTGLQQYFTSTVWYQTILLICDHLMDLLHCRTINAT